MTWSGASVRLSLLLFVLAACSRVPVPNSEQPITTLSQIPTTEAVSPPSATPEFTPTTTVAPTIAVPSDTVTPTALPAIAQTPVAYDRNSRAVLVEADITGSAAMVPRDMHLPTYRLYADGFVIRAGEATPLSTGLDAAVRVGHLSDSQVQDLLAYLTASGFFSYSPYYEPRPAPPNLPTARISVYLAKAKTVTVYGPGFPGTPQAFLDAFNRIIRATPADDKSFVPTDAYLVATPAGSVSEVRSLGDIAEWPNSIGKTLSGSSDGTTITGNVFASAAQAVSKTQRMLLREGTQVYLVRFAPNLPRAVHLTDWVGTILQGVREFEGRAFDIVGYYRGANLLGEASGNPPTANSWVIQDDTGAMYVTGAAPQLDPNSRADIWNVVRIRAVVVYIRNGTSYLDARSVTVQ